MGLDMHTAATSRDMCNDCYKEEVNVWKLRQQHQQLLQDQPRKRKEKTKLLLEPSS